MTGKWHNSLPSRKRTWRLKLLWLLLWVFWFCDPGLALAQPPVNEYQVKAAFLFHFVQLVDWPPGAVKDAKALVLCTYGDDPFAGELDSMVSGKSVGSRSIRVRHVRHAQDVHDCQMLFVGKKESKHVLSLLTDLGDDPIATVGETDNFIQAGGMIGFCLDDNKIRFDINLQSAGRAKLKISSRLLLLAKTLVGSPEQR